MHTTSRYGLDVPKCLTGGHGDTDLEVLGRVSGEGVFPVAAFQGIIDVQSTSTQHVVVCTCSIELYAHTTHRYDLL